MGSQFKIVLQYFHCRMEHTSSSWLIWSFFMGGTKIKLTLFARKLSAFWRIFTMLFSCVIIFPLYNTIQLFAILYRIELNLNIKIYFWSVYLLILVIVTYWICYWDNIYQEYSIERELKSEGIVTRKIPLTDSQIFLLV